MAVWQQWVPGVLQRSLRSQHLLCALLWLWPFAALGLCFEVLIAILILFLRLGGFSLASAVLLLVPECTVPSSNALVTPPSTQATVAPNSAPQIAQPAVAQHTTPQHQVVVAPADEITALRAQIAELKHGGAHGNPLPARASAPQQALVVDPAAVEHIQADLAGAKEDPKCITLPALQPGHKVSALSLLIPPKVEETFKQYRYVPYTALTHMARSKAFLHGEESSFVFTQDGSTTKGLDHSNELSILTMDWIAVAKVMEERTAFH
ncbi:hypothetical protein C8R48DRAFT_668086 [Suillus tomentosus]|nr:hypothetical protein C8R48DRAFT_668086 [Suillus tomentosus]